MKKRELLLNNVLVTEPCYRTEIFEVSEKIKKYVIENDLFPVGPTIYFRDDNEKYRIAVQVDEKVALGESGVISFVECIHFPVCLYERVADDELLDVTYLEMLEYAKKEGKVKEEIQFVNFSFDVYGETVTDVYYPVER